MNTAIARSAALCLCAALGLLSGVASAADAEARNAQAYKANCSACHDTGAAGAPKVGDLAAWQPRLEKGYKTLLDHALNGFNAMPPRGGNPALSDDTLRHALAFMLIRSSAEGTEKTAEAPAPAAKPAPAKAKPAAKPTAPRQVRTGVNRFNRLMKPPSQRNPPPAKDGIHDPANDGTHILQPPRESFAALPNSSSGNRVDWVAALEQGKIAPRFDRDDPNKQPVVMDLNIIREVKGSMPDVVYPHKQHTEWLDCSNCHPDIFIPKKGANQISMASILLGEDCGVCHGKVAFPIADCRKCHSRKKTGQVKR